MVPVQSIRVGPFDVAIDELSGEDRDQNLGTYLTSELTIRIRNEFASEQQRAETLLHELLHALWNIYGVKVKEGEERAVGLLSIALAAVIRDNPELMNYMQRAFKV